MPGLANERDDEALRREARRWVTRLTSGEATDADAWGLSAWRAQSPAHEAAFAEAARLWRLAGVAATQVAMADSARANPIAGLGRRGVAVAALASLGVGLFAGGSDLGLWPSITELMADIRTDTGERRRVVLEDDSVVELNTRTSLSVTYDTAERRVDLLDGEAVFSVSHDSGRPFSVRAAGGKTTAIGTVFGVRTLGDGARVICIEGRVRVAHADSATVLIAEQTAPYGAGGVEPATAAETASLTAWRSGLLVFRDTPLEDVVDELNRYRPGRLVLANGALRTRQVSGVFHLDRLDEMLAHMRQTLRVEVTPLVGGVALLR